MKNCGWFRSFTTIGLALIANSCGGSNEADLERQFSISEVGTPCAEVNQVASIAIQNHLYRRAEDADDVYKQAIKATAQMLIELDKNVKSTSFSTSLQNIVRDASFEGAKALRDCRHIKQLDEAINAAEKARLSNEWTAGEDSEWMNVQEYRSQNQIYRFFLSRFARALDPFSSYRNPSYWGPYTFGIRINDNYLFRFGMTPKEIKSVEIIAVQKARFQKGTLEKDLPQVGDRIIEVLPGKEIWKTLPASIRKRITKEKDPTWVPVGTFFDRKVNVDLDDVFSGSPDRKVSIRVLRGKETFNITLSGIKRRDMNDAIPLVHGEIRDQSIYVNIIEFDEGLALQFINTLRSLQSEWRSKFPDVAFQSAPIILDLRFNPGGSVNEQRRLSSFFLDSGVVGTQRMKSWKNPDQWTDREVRTINAGEKFDNPILIVVNNSSISAAEIFTQTLKETGRAIVVGDSTFGKAISQTPIILGDLSHLDGTFYFTEGVFFGSEGKSIFPYGIRPQVGVKDPKIEKLRKECANEERKCAPQSMADALMIKKLDLEDLLKDAEKIETDVARTSIQFEETALTPQERKIVALSEDPQLKAALLLARRPQKMPF